MELSSTLITTVIDPYIKKETTPQNTFTKTLLVNKLLKEKSLSKGEFRNHGSYAPSDVCVFNEY